jgi:hypothetical protein
MPNPDNKHHQAILFNLANHAIIPHAIPPESLAIMAQGFAQFYQVPLALAKAFRRFSVTGFRRKESMFCV